MNRATLFHRGERPHPGGASGYRVRHGDRSGQEPDSDRCGRASSEILPLPIEVRGHAIECRINAEHPETFAPCPGRITGLNLPGGMGIRVDTAAHTDCTIPPYYDSLVAKLVAYGRDRTEAIARIQRALSMFVVEGIWTTIPMHERILRDPDFLRGDFDTNFLKRFAPVKPEAAKK